MFHQFSFAILYTFLSISAVTAQSSTNITIPSQPTSFPSGTVGVTEATASATANVYNKNGAESSRVASFGAVVLAVSAAAFAI